jgi:hypothetical protein
MQISRSDANGGFRQWGTRASHDLDSRLWTQIGRFIRCQYYTESCVGQTRPIADSMMLYRGHDRRATDGALWPATDLRYIYI